jgi:hypothetical protein
MKQQQWDDFNKSYKIILLNPAHQDLSNNTKDTFQFLRNFQLQFNLFFSEEFSPQVQTP